MSRPAALLLGALALVASVISAASLPHLHFGAEAGYYNHEHDLVTFAAMGGGAPLPVGTTVGPLGTPIARAAIARVGHPAAPVRGLAESRAPPLP